MGPPVIQTISHLITLGIYSRGVAGAPVRNKIMSNENHRELALYKKKNLFCLLLNKEHLGELDFYRNIKSDSK